MTNPNLPAEWDNADTLAGYDLHDKADLVGVPFRVFQAEFTTNAKGVQAVIVSVELTDRSRIQFRDGSTGVLAQLKEHVTEKGHGSAIDSGEPVTLNLVSGRGLRVSAYDKEVRGRTEKARTYYLTARGMVDEPAPTKAAPRKRASS